MRILKFLLFTIVPIMGSFITTYENWLVKQTDIVPVKTSFDSYMQNIDYISNTTTSSWSLSPNKFAGYTPRVFNSFNKGYTPNNFTPKSNIYYPDSNKTLPETWDWRNTSLVGPVKDQQQCGSCWAFSAIASLEGQFSKLMKLQKPIPMSEQEMVDCVKNIESPDKTNTCCFGCNGGEMYAVYQFMNQKQHGQDDTETQYPYKAIDQNCLVKQSLVDSVKLTGFTTVKPNDEIAMKNALYYIGPLSIGVYANTDWQLYEKGVYNPTESQCSSNPADQDHGVAIVGYGTENGLEYWVIRNSWGKNWGEDGYIRIVRGKNACGIANSVIFPNVKQL